MGGEQYPLLMYGPKINFPIEEWVEKFCLIDKKKWVKNFMLNEKHDYEVPYDSEDEEGIDIIFEQEYKKHEFFDLLTKFLEKHHMTVVFNNNFWWKEPYIGMEVKDYNTFSEVHKKVVNDFCKQYNLPKPTFYAGITGELE